MFKRYINNVYFLVSVVIFKYECCNGLDELDTCGAADEACGRNGDTNYFRSTNWEPFVYDSNLKWAEFASIFKQYVVWHNATYYNTAIPCEEKRVVVFTPNAGLGDSLGALSSAMAHTFRTGRLFFIDWKPYNWTVGLKALPFQYDYTIAKARMINGKRLICPDTDPSSLLSGHITSQHPLINEETVNDLNFGYDGMMREIVQPSTKVQQIVDSVISPVVQHQHNTRLVALVIRTGEGEYNQFLSRGDEINFIKCFRNYAQDYQRKQQIPVRFKVFVTSDDVTTKQNVVNELRNESNNFDLDVEVLTLNDSIVHVMHLSAEDGKKKSIREKLRKTYAEYFLIGSCEVLFLTHGSLFGRAASERGVAHERNIHFLSDSQCDGKREKYSYLKCHEPKYPDVCGNL